MSVLNSVHTGLTVLVGSIATGWHITSTLWVPVIDETDITRTIYVSPETRNTELIARGVKSTDITELIVISNPLTQGEEAQDREEGHILADALINGLLGKKAAGFTITRVEQPITTDPGHWRELRAFATFLRVHLKG